MVQPTAMRILVEGVNIRKKAVRPSPKYPNGGIIEMEGPIHYSNVQHAEKYDAKPNRTASKPAKPAAKKAAKKAKATETGNEE
jgi:large subunit ribosomal protein L24